METFTETMVLDVGGSRYWVLKSMFMKWPNTRISRIIRSKSVKEILSLCDGYFPSYASLDGKTELFFNRNPEDFDLVLDVYRIGKLHRAKHMCALNLPSYLEYWGFDESYLSACCSIDHYYQKHMSEMKVDVEDPTVDRGVRVVKDDHILKMYLQKLRVNLWELTEYPDSSAQARVFSLVSLAMVLVSTATFILETFPEFQARGTYPIVHRTIHMIDIMTILFFSIEFATRFLCSPTKLRFFYSPMNTIDLLAIVPFYVTLILETMEDAKIIGKAGKMIRLVRVLRVLRIFKLVRHFDGLQAMLRTMQEAYKDLGLLGTLVTLQTLLFSILVFVTEKEGGDEIWSLMDSTFWTIMTISTVGSVGLQPSSTIGRFLGGICPLMGITLKCLPIPIVVNSFADGYRNRILRSEIQRRKKKLLNKRRDAIN